MPRYFFGYEDQPPEEEGEEFPNDAAARAVAVKIAEELGRGHSQRPRISVYDALLRKLG